MVRQKRGRYRTIRVDRSESVIAERPTIKKIEKAINCDCCDTVLLNRQNRMVMVVDDMGMYIRKLQSWCTEPSGRVIDTASTAMWPS